MKIGINTKYIFSEKVYEKVKEAGFEGLDYSFAVDARVFEEPRKVWTEYFAHKRAELQACGLTPFQTHATFPTNVDGAARLTDVSLERMKKEIEAAAILGSPYIVIHPINFAIEEFRREEEYKTNIDCFSRLEPILSEFDLKLGVENMWLVDSLRSRYAKTSCSLAEDMIKIIDELNSDRFVACLDTGHVFMHGQSPATAARKLNNRLKLMHASDNFGSHDSHKAPGQGSIDWKEYVKALKEIGYDGVFSLELNCTNEFAISEETGFAYLRYAYFAVKEILKSAGAAL